MGNLVLQAAKNALAEEKTKLQKLQHTQKTTREQLQQVLRVAEEHAAEAAEVSRHNFAIGTEQLEMMQMLTVNLQTNLPAPSSTSQRHPPVN